MKILKFFKERDPTQGSIVTNALVMTTPMWANSAYFMVFMFLEMYWVAQLGAKSIAAVGIGSMAFMLLMALIQGIVMASSAIVGDLVGKKDEASLSKIAKEILSISCGFCLVLAAIGYFLGPILLRLLGAEAEVLSLAVTYLRISAVGGVVTFLFWIIDGMLKSARAINLAAIAVGLVITLNIILGYSLILGNFGFPQMGVAGAALARSFSAGAGTLVGLWLLAKGKSSIKMNFKNWRDFKVRPQTLKEIVKIAFPVTLQRISQPLTNMVMVGIVATWGTLALAAYSIGERILRMCSILALDLGKTTTVAVSTNLGASQVQRAKKTSWIHSGLNALLIGGAGLGLFIFARQVVSLLSQEPEILEIGINYLRITTFAGIGYAILAIGLILERAFAGAKDTKTPMFVYWAMAGIQIGLALLLPKLFSLGINGIWLAILVGTIFQGSVLAILFKLGHWKPKK